MKKKELVIAMPQAQIDPNQIMVEFFLKKYSREQIFQLATDCQLDEKCGPSTSGVHFTEFAEKVVQELLDLEQAKRNSLIWSKKPLSLIVKEAKFLGLTQVEELIKLKSTIDDHEKIVLLARQMVALLQINLKALKKDLNECPLPPRIAKRLQLLLSNPVAHLSVEKDEAMVAFFNLVKVFHSIKGKVTAKNHEGIADRIKEIEDALTKRSVSYKPYFGDENSEDALLRLESLLMTKDLEMRSLESLKKIGKMIGIKPVDLEKSQLINAIITLASRSANFVLVKSYDFPVQMIEWLQMILLGENPETSTEIFNVLAWFVKKIQLITDDKTEHRYILEVSQKPGNMLQLAQLMKLDLSAAFFEEQSLSILLAQMSIVKIADKALKGNRLAALIELTEGKTVGPTIRAPSELPPLVKVKPQLKTIRVYNSQGILEEKQVLSYDHVVDFTAHQQSESKKIATEILEKKPENEIIALAKHLEVLDDAVIAETSAEKLGHLVVAKLQKGIADMSKDEDRIERFFKSAQSLGINVNPSDFALSWDLANNQDFFNIVWQAAFAESQSSDHELNDYPKQFADWLVKNYKSQPKNIISLAKSLNIQLDSYFKIVIRYEYDLSKVQILAEKIASQLDQRALLELDNVISLAKQIKYAKELPDDSVTQDANKVFSFILKVVVSAVKKGIIKPTPKPKKRVNLGKNMGLSSRGLSVESREPHRLTSLSVSSEASPPAPTNAVVSVETVSVETTKLEQVHPGEFEEQALTTSFEPKETVSLVVNSTVILAPSNAEAITSEQVATNPASESVQQDRVSKSSLVEEPEFKEQVKTPVAPKEAVSLVANSAAILAPSNAEATILEQVVTNLGGESVQQDKMSKSSLVEELKSKEQVKTPVDPKEAVAFVAHSAVIPAPSSVETTTTEQVATHPASEPVQQELVRKSSPVEESGVKEQVTLPADPKKTLAPSSPETTTPEQVVTHSSGKLIQQDKVRKLSPIELPEVKKQVVTPPIKPKKIKRISTIERDENAIEQNEQFLNLKGQSPRAILKELRRMNKLKRKSKKNKAVHLDLIAQTEMYSPSLSTPSSPETSSADSTPRSESPLERAVIVSKGRPGFVEMIPKEYIRRSLLRDRLPHLPRVFGPGITDDSSAKKRTYYFVDDLSAYKKHLVLQQFLRLHLVDASGRLLIIKMMEKHTLNHIFAGRKFKARLNKTEIKHSESVDTHLGTEDVKHSSMPHSNSFFRSSQSNPEKFKSENVKSSVIPNSSSFLRSSQSNPQESQSDLDSDDFLLRSTTFVKPIGVGDLKLQDTYFGIPSVDFPTHSRMVESLYRDMCSHFQFVLSEYTDTLSTIFREAVAVAVNFFSPTKENHKILKRITGVDTLESQIRAIDKSFEMDIWQKAQKVLLCVSDLIYKFDCDPENKKIGSQSSLRADLASYFSEFILLFLQHAKLSEKFKQIFLENVDRIKIVWENPSFCSWQNNSTNTWRKEIINNLVFVPATRADETLLRELSKIISRISQARAMKFQYDEAPCLPRTLTT